MFGHIYEQTVHYSELSIHQTIVRNTDRKKFIIVGLTYSTYSLTTYSLTYPTYILTYPTYSLLPTLPTVLPTPTYSLTHQHISQFYPSPPMVLITFTCATTFTYRFTPHLWSCPTPPMAQPLPTVLPPIYGTTSSPTRTANATYHSRIVSVELQETVEVFLE